MDEQKGTQKNVLCEKKQDLHLQPQASPRRAKVTNHRANRRLSLAPSSGIRCMAPFLLIGKAELFQQALKLNSTLDFIVNNPFSRSGSCPTIPTAASNSSARVRTLFKGYSTQQWFASSVSHSFDFSSSSCGFSHVDDW